MAVSDPHLASIERKVQKADKYACNRQDSCRDLGIDEYIQVMEQKPTPVWLDSGFGFQPVLEQSQGTRPGQQFRKHSPNKRSDMQPAKDRARTCQNGAEDNPQNEQRMQGEDANC